MEKLYTLCVCVCVCVLVCTLVHTLVHKLECMWRSEVNLGCFRYCHWFCLVLQGFLVTRFLTGSVVFVK